MQYTTEFRNKDEALALADRIRAEVNPARQYRYMEFCGGHTHVLARWGLTDLLPANIRMIHGPGCPVCVLPIGRVDMALDLALNKGVTLCTYADMMRVPGSGGKTLFIDGLTVVSHCIITGTYRKCLGSMSGILSFDDGGFRFIQFVRVIRDVF